VKGVHAHRQFQILTVDGKKGNFLSAIFHMEDSEVFGEEMEDIILFEKSLNEATPVATEPEPHPHSVGELYCVP